jgi:hypothetical protein
VTAGEAGKVLGNTPDPALFISTREALGHQEKLKEEHRHRAKVSAWDTWRDCIGVCLLPPEIYQSINRVLLETWSAVVLLGSGAVVTPS